MHSSVRNRFMRGCAAAVLGLSAHAAGAQLLDFGSGAPEPGTGHAALALAATLTEQADDIAQGRHAGEISSVDAARIAVRRLAAAMLTQGEYAGADGSARIVAARRIARRLERLDAFLEAADAPTPEIVRAQAVQAAADIPELAPELDRMLRNAFAACTRSAATPPKQIAWTPETPPVQPRLDAEIDRWEREGTLSPAALQALRSLESRLTELERWPAYRRSIDAVRAQVREAGLCFTLDRRWLGDEAADALIARFDSALVLAADPGATDAARARLRTVALLAVLSPAVGPFTSGPSARAARDSLRETMIGRGWNPADEERSIALLARAIRQIQRGERFDDDTAVIRQLRPAWRVFTRQRREAQDALSETFSMMLASPGAETDPAVLAALDAHARTIDDLGALVAASAVMSRAQIAPSGPRGPVTPRPVNPRSREPIASAGWQRPANVFLELGQQLSKPSTADEAHRALRALADDVARLAALPGEESLRTGSPTWTQLIGAPPNQLAAAIDAARMRWISAIGREGQSADARRMKALHDVMELLDAAVRVRGQASRGATARMDAWPGWSLSPRAAAGMYARIATQLPRLSALAMQGEPDAAIDAITEARVQASPLLLVGAVDRLAEAARIGPEPDTPQSAVWALSVGPPETDDWLIPLRANLAGFCRYAEEAYAPPKDADPTTRADVNRARAYCGELASHALEKLEAR